MAKLPVILEIFCLRRKKAKKEKTGRLITAEFIQFDFATIRAATADFSVLNMLGEGGLGVVYKGTLKSGREIAVKRLSYELVLSTEVFMTESRVVARYQHTNLVKHLGFCAEGKQKFLVYEYLPNASLAHFLFDPSKRALLKWETWYKIILGTAEGLKYLHEDTDATILHHRLKISNVLLDEEMNPKIADFGMSKIFERRQEHVNTFSTAVGSYVYVAPEYIFTGTYSAKADVYSFGVVVLEIVSNITKGKSSWSSITDGERIQARKLWAEDRLSELVHPTLSARCSETDVKRCLQIGFLCVQKDAENRPTMTEVILMLTGKVDIPLPSVPVV